MPNHVNYIEQMVLTIKPPAHLYIGQSQSEQRFVVDGCLTTHAQFPPWPAAPDILMASASRTFVGLSYNIPEKYRSALHSLCSQFDPKIFRYNGPSQDEKRTPYGNDESHYFEVIWTDRNPDILLPAQLAEDGWYYAYGMADVPQVDAPWEQVMRQSGVRLEQSTVVAIGITEISSILRAFDLILPEDYVVPVSNLGSLGVLT